MNVGTRAQRSPSGGHRLSHNVPVGGHRSQAGSEPQRGQGSSGPQVPPRGRDDRIGGLRTDIGGLASPRTARLDNTKPPTPRYGTPFARITGTDPQQQRQTQRTAIASTRERSALPLTEIGIDIDAFNNAPRAVGTYLDAAVRHTFTADRAKEVGNLALPEKHRRLADKYGKLSRGMGELVKHPAAGQVRRSRQACSRLFEKNGLGFVQQNVGT